MAHSPPLQYPGDCKASLAFFGQMPRKQNVLTDPLMVRGTEEKQVIRVSMSSGSFVSPELPSIRRPSQWIPDVVRTKSRGIPKSCKEGPLSHRHPQPPTCFRATSQRCNFVFKWTFSCHLPGGPEMLVTLGSGGGCSPASAGHLGTSALLQL